MTTAIEKTWASGRYVGREEVLRGQTALLRHHETDANKVLAQFDDLALPSEYTHGWAEFARSEFKILRELST